MDRSRACRRLAGTVALLLTGCGGGVFIGIGDGDVGCFARAFDDVGQLSDSAVVSLPLR